MDYLWTIYDQISSLAIIAIICILAQKLLPSIPQQKIWRKDTKTDIGYWFFLNVIFSNFVRLFIASALVLFTLLNPEILQERSYYENLPFYFKIFLSLLAIDFAGYWAHRMFHHKKLWKFHSIHHSPKEIDWLSSARFHPVEILLVLLILHLFVIIILGLGLKTAALAFFIRSSYGYVVHSNVKLSYGPLDYIIACPLFHRWHHTMEREGQDKNFSGVFSLWDYIFGTAYYPKTRQPHNFGIKADIGNSLWQQIKYPFINNK